MGDIYDGLYEKIKILEIEEYLLFIYRRCPAWKL